jgi:hexosaminidase
MEYMAFPRMCALAEVAWTPRERRDYADFLSRLPAHLERLRAMGVSFRPLDGKV